MAGVVMLQNVINELMEQMNDSAIDCANELFDYSEGAYISDCFGEIADSHVDIYNYNLVSWLQESVDNIYMLEEVAQEGLIDFKNYDFYRHIQTAQYENYLHSYYADEENIIKFVALKYLLKSTESIGSDLLDNIYYELNGVDNNDYVGDIFESVNNCLDPDYTE